MKNIVSNLNLPVSIIRILFLILATGIGWAIYQISQPSTLPINDTSGRNNTSQSTASGIFTDQQMGIKFSYPKEWNVVDESSKIATLFRLQSPDYKEIKDNNNSSVGYTGTVITVMAARIAFTYDEDRASVTDPNNRPQSTNIQDFTLKGRRAFSYTNEPYGGAGQTFTVEIDIKDKTPVKFIFQPSNAKEQYDETYKSVFDTIINSVEYL